MAVAIHVVYVRPISVDAVGNPIDKNDPHTKISAVMRSTDMQPRVIPDINIPSSANYPTIHAYLIAEAAAGFVVKHMDNTMIVTYPAGS